MKNLEEFENRNSDWLAKEKAYEKYKNPWNLDEARIIKEEHEKRHQEIERYSKNGFNNNANIKDEENYYSQPVAIFKIMKIIIFVIFCMWFFPFLISLLLFFLPLF